MGLAHGAAIIVGSFAANAFTLARQDALTADAVLVVIAISVGAAAQAVIAATLVTRTLGHRASLSRGTQIVVFLLLAGPVGCVVNATIATTTQVSSGLISLDKAMVVWITWWAGDAIGVVVFAPVFLMLMPGQREVWAGRRVRVAVSSLVGVTLFAGFFAQADAQARSERELVLAQLASDAANELERNVARHQEVLEGLGSFFESAEQVDVEEFATYARSALARFPNLQALSWNPLLTQDEVAAFETYQREEQGLEGYTVTERAADGSLVPVAPRAEYVAVGYIEPLEGNRPALGFDINSNPDRREAIDRARSEGVPAATGPIDLVQDSGTQRGMLALVPVHEGGHRRTGGEGVDPEVRGFAVGVYRLGDLLNDTYGDAAWGSVDVRLVDVTDEAAPQEIATRPAPQAPTVDRTSASTSIAASEEFSVYGRAWRVEIAPTSGALASRTRAVTTSIDVFGLILLTVLQAFILLVTGHERVAVRQAEQASVEASTDDLTGLLNRRAFVRSLDRVRERTLADGSSDVLLYLDLDRFKVVNDRGGHDAGDRLLASVAQALRATVRSRDITARLGGDEFAVILNNCDVEQGLTIARTLETSIRSQSVNSDVGPLSVGVSIGVALIDASSSDIDHVIRHADDACYAAKNQGGGVVIDSSGVPPRR